MLGFDLRKAIALSHYHQEFEEFQKIGSGGFSTVYKVKNKRDHRFYALKVVKIKPSQHKYQISEYIDKVLSEAKLLSGLNHSNILKYHGCWIDGELKSEKEVKEKEEQDEEGQIELVYYEDSQNSLGFEFGEGSQISREKDEGDTREKSVGLPPDLNIFGEDLTKYKQIRIYILTELGQYSVHKYVQNRNKTQKHNIQPHQNYQIILDIIDGLSYIHSQNIIHRDLKLENVIIDEKGKCKIIDFGLAKRTRAMKSMNQELCNSSLLNEEEIERHSKSVGTKIFSSPQQTSSQSYDYRTDIYSLAMMMAILFSDHKTIHEERQLLSNIRDKKLEKLPLPERLKEIIIRCLGEQKERPSLKQIKQVVLSLMRETRKEQNCEKGRRRLGKYGYVSKDNLKRMPLTTINKKTVNQMEEQINTKT